MKKPTTKDPIRHAFKCSRLNWTMPFVPANLTALTPCRICRKAGKALWNGVVCESCLHKRSRKKP